MCSMNRDEPLFTTLTGRRRAGRTRRGLDADIAAARERGGALSFGLIAAARTLADQIDQMDHYCLMAPAKPYDRVPLTGLVREYAELHAQLFVAAGAADPIARALADFMAGTQTPSD